MSFTNRQLQIFLEVAKDCNFHRAADRLNISQPSVSIQISNLEKHLGVLLFNRKRGSPVEISNAGKRLLIKGKFILREHKALKENLQNLDDRVPFKLIVAVGPYILDSVIRPRLRAFYDQGLTLDIEFIPIPPRNNMLSLLKSNEVDAAVYTGDLPSSNEVDFEIIEKLDCAIFGSPDLANTVGTNVDLISAAPFILPPIDSDATPWVMRMLNSVGITPEIVIARSQFPDIISHVSRSGAGLAVLLDEQVKSEKKTDKLVKIPINLGTIDRIMIKGSKTLLKESDPILGTLRAILAR